MIPNNVMHPKWNKESVKAGTFYILAPFDFRDYDEIWANVMVHGTTGAPTSGSVKVYWQTTPDLSGGLYHDRDPVWVDLYPKRNSHLFKGGLDFPMKVVSTVPAAFSPEVNVVRGLSLGVGLVRLKVVVDLVGGTDPAYVISLGLFTRRTTSDSKPSPTPVVITQNLLNTNLRDVWGYSVRNKDAANTFKLMLRDGAAGGAIMANDSVAADSSVTRMFDRPIRFENGLFANTVTTGTGADVVIYTTDNLDV